MNYNWNWEVLLQPVATGEDATYLGWIIHGFGITFALTFDLPQHPPDRAVFHMVLCRA
jgi:hypothetical protein